MAEDDDYDWQWQELRLRTMLDSVDGNAFEALFREIAKRLWKASFTPTIPMGSRGDLKCDGFNADNGEVFQCYGPRYGQASVDDALEKIDTDFDGAVDHWKELLRKWTFVVGLYQGRVPSELVRRVQEKSKEHSIPAEILTRDDIIGMAKTLSLDDRAALFGRAPARAEVVRSTTYENIGRALAYIRGELATDPLVQIALPTAVEKKVEYNILPALVLHFLGVGQLGADQVRKDLAEKVDPLEAERMADGFRCRYLELSSSGAEPIGIFGQMVVFAGGANGNVEREQLPSRSLLTLSRPAKDLNSRGNPVGTGFPE
ncbi:hypothetical protein [Bradyrhizobium manausense]|uniref:Uncharacterized protein n=1 Tax=Bradyrhizobium manausense TaxID=989370 RepID=A0A0R3CWP6_9BRAD|nr:hypothetical protein [Bradyrhizobium manausense]KRQ01990.1 hypothetical protein AOQ71_35925 [Bradyrhizobium manausense]